jgi:hypothetical protein
METKTKKCIGTWDGIYDGGCREIKPITEFGKGTDKDGHHFWCKECDKKYHGPTLITGPEYRRLFPGRRAVSGIRHKPDSK